MATLSEFELRILAHVGTRHKRMVATQEAPASRTRIDIPRILCDLAWLANGSGGWLLIGAGEAQSSVKLRGVDTKVANRIQARVRAALTSDRTGTEASCVEMALVGNFAAGPVLVIRVHHQPHPAWFVSEEQKRIYPVRTTDGSYRAFEDLEKYQAIVPPGSTIQDDWRAFSDDMHQTAALRRAGARVLGMSPQATTDIGGQSSTPVQLLDWRVLPEGPFGSMPGTYVGLSGFRRPGKHPEQDRLAVLSALNPIARYEGLHLGTAVYQVAVFEGVAVAESPAWGNALFYYPTSAGDWKHVFRLSKGRAVATGAQRIIHSSG